MPATPPPTTPPDNTRGERLRAHDTDAFAMLYDRYFQATYDFCLRTVRNPDLAADAVQTAFIRAWEHPPSAGRPHNLKAWLFTIARNAALDELRKQQRIVTDRREDAMEEQEAFDAVDESRLTDPQAASQDQEVVELVWGAAKTLSPREYSLLDMHLRQGLTAQEIAEEFGVTHGNVYTMLTRLRSSLDRSVRALLLSRRGHADCADLRTLLAAIGEAPGTPEDVRSLQRHADTCPVCNENQSRFVAPAAIFAGLSMVAVVPELSVSIWSRVTADIGGATGSMTGGGGLPSHGPGAPAVPPTPTAGVSPYWWAAASTTAKVAITAATVALGGGIAAVVVVAGFGDGASPEPMRGETPTPAAVAAPATDRDQIESPAIAEDAARPTQAPPAQAAMNEVTEPLAPEPGVPAPLEAAAYTESVSAIIAALGAAAATIQEGESSSSDAIVARQQELIDRTEQAFEEIAALSPPAEFAADHHRFLVLSYEILDARRNLIALFEAARILGVWRTDDAATANEIGVRLEEIGQAMSADLSPAFLDLVQDLFPAPLPAASP